MVPIQRIARPIASLSHKKKACGTMASAASTDVEASAVAGPPVNNGAPTFQDAISRLQTYWANQGCAVYLPHNTEVRFPFDDDYIGFPLPILIEL